MMKILLGLLFAALLLGSKSSSAYRAGSAHGLGGAATTAPHRLTGELPKESLADRLQGVWVADEHVGPPIEYSVTACRTGSDWRVKTDRRSASPTAMVNGELQASFGDGSLFRAKIASNGEKADGFWVQPASAVLVSYATPVPLIRAPDGCWHGKLSPLESRVRFSLVIYRRSDGALAADFIDPRWGARKGMTVIANWRGAILSDARIRLTAIWDIHPVGLTAHWDRVAEDLVVISDALPSPIKLHRSAGGAPGLRARSGSPPDYAEAPAAQGDGWPTASLSSEGLDPRPIERLVKSIEAGGDLASATNKIQALLIARRGKLVFEDYFYDFRPGQLHDMRSAGKTIAPILVGAALQSRASAVLDQPISSIFSNYRPFKSDDDRKKAMTVRDLMSMRYDCDDNNPKAPGNEDSTQQQTATPDWYRYTLDLPMAAAPGGEHALYCSIDLNLAGGVARTVSGEWLPELFQEKIAAPLQIRDWAMNLMPTGEGYTGGGLYLTPRDQLKLGQLYLDGGVWNGRRVVTADWARESVTPYGVFKPVIPRDLNHRYGLGWHVHDLAAGGRKYREFSAEGAGGQFVIVVPELQLVVGIAGADYTSIQWYNWIFDVMQNYVIPAVRQP